MKKLGLLVMFAGMMMSQMVFAECAFQKKGSLFDQIDKPVSTTTAPVATVPTATVGATR